MPETKKKKKVRFCDFSGSLYQGKGINDLYQGKGIKYFVFKWEKEGCTMYNNDISCRNTLLVY